MTSISAYNVVEQMTYELAARRRVASGRRAAYLALANVILERDARQERLVLPGTLNKQTPRGDWESAAA
jgi:hypothetical protein